MNFQQKSGTVKLHATVQVQVTFLGTRAHAQAGFPSLSRERTVHLWSHSKSTGRSRHWQFHWSPGVQPDFFATPQDTGGKASPEAWAHSRLWPRCTRNTSCRTSICRNFNIRSKTWPQCYTLRKIHVLLVSPIRHSRSPFCSTRLTISWLQSRSTQIRSPHFIWLVSLFTGSLSLFLWSLMCGRNQDTRPTEFRSRFYRVCPLTGSLNTFCYTLCFL